MPLVNHAKAETKDDVNKDQSIILRARPDKSILAMSTAQRALPHAVANIPAYNCILFNLVACSAAPRHVMEYLKKVFVDALIVD